MSSVFFPFFFNLLRYPLTVRERKHYRGYYVNISLKKEDSVLLYFLSIKVPVIKTVFMYRTADGKIIDQRNLDTLYPPRWNLIDLQVTFQVRYRWAPASPVKFWLILLVWNHSKQVFRLCWFILLLSGRQEMIWSNTYFFRKIFNMINVFLFEDVSVLKMLPY